MGSVAVVTDSNSGISQAEAKELGVWVLPMPFYIDGKLYFEDINLTQEEFYKLLENDADISTSMPSPGDVTDLWDKLLKDFDEVVYIPMSSGLSSSCQTAVMLAEDYDGRVQVVNNQRISITQRRSVMDALELTEFGKGAAEIKQILEDQKFESSIYITVDTLKYLKKGGRVTPAAAALGTLLKIKPVLTIQGEKLDAFAKARAMKQAKQIMIQSMKNDLINRFGDSEATGCTVHLDGAYTKDEAAAMKFKAEIEKEFSGAVEMIMTPLSLSVSCHIGPGALAIGCSRIMKI
ncbi:MAG: DegV family protein [Eubacterium sp.]|nr:DegV family protein [Eubacterium sp.]